MKMNRLTPIFLMAVVLVISSCTKAIEKPNIILIMFDDLGYGDLGCYGNKIIKTPHIDKLAEGGLRFTDFYAAGSWCSPSRKGLMTGVHPYRKGMKTIKEKVTIAEMLQAKGYGTALLGKWHLGMGEGSHPLDQGFDYFYGTAGSNDWGPPKGKSQNYQVFKDTPESGWITPLYQGKEMIEKAAPQSLFTQRYTKEAVRIIEESGDSPFFIYLAHNMPHAPVFPSVDFKGKSQGGIYGDVVEELDWSIGQIMSKLKEQKKEKNTLVIITSDNGPWTMFKEFGGVAAPLRGEKGTGWEGGSGVPALFYWPETIEPGVTSEFAVSVDLFATLASITNSALPTTYRMDSKDMSDVLFNHGKSKRESYLFYSGARWNIPFSYRSGDYKIHVQTNDMSRNPTNGSHVSEIKHNPPLLFNLKEDRSERINISEKESSIVNRLTREFKQVHEDLLENNQ
jgi:arylsulfatase A